MSGRRNPYARPDARTRMAKSQGYPARSVFKLSEIDERTHLLRPGQVLLDLGAAPGSWSMYASTKVGLAGRIVAVDLQSIALDLGKNVEIVQANAFDLSEDWLVTKGPFDGVLSDMAPSTSGSKVRDQSGSFELVLRALEVAHRSAKPGSFFVAKVFMGPDFGTAKAAVATAYEQCRTLRPRGTRPNSSELFLVGLRKRGGALSPDATLLSPKEDPG